MTDLSILTALSRVDVLRPLVVHLSPGMLTALGAGVVSAATVTATGLMGRWFTRMEREARAESPSDAAPRRPQAVSRTSWAGTTPLTSLELNPVNLGPAAPMAPLAASVPLVPVVTPARPATHAVG